MQWLTLMFQPKRRMELNDEQCNLAIYIFGCPPNDEVIVSTNMVYCLGTRLVLHDLKPKKMICQDV